jgi:hypothetical protein
MCVLAVSNSEHTRGHDVETMRSRRRSLPRAGATEGAHVDQREKQYTGKRRAGSGFPERLSIPGDRECQELA